MTTIASSTSALALNRQVPTDREKLHKAAEAFEAILVRRMLASARASHFGNELFSSQALDTFNAMQDEKLAQITAESGSLGFARVIEAQLAKRADLAGGNA